MPFRRVDAVMKGQDWHAGAFVHQAAADAPDEHRRLEVLQHIRRVFVAVVGRKCVLGFQVEEELGN